MLLKLKTTTLGIISREEFVIVIESIRKQVMYDREVSESISRAFGFGGDVRLYDNGEYLKSLMMLLRIFFPVSDEGFCEIEHYLFVLDFGRLGEVYESPIELYDRLMLSNV